MSDEDRHIARDGLKHSPVDSKALSNLFLDWAESDGLALSPMKLQKLLYFCHAEFLTETGTPLIKQGFEAWDYGPVIPSIYREFKKFSDQRITGRANSFDPVQATNNIATCKISIECECYIRTIFNKYKFFSAASLSHLSHMPRGPWRHARSMFANGLNADRKITDDMIGQLHHHISGV